MDGPHKTELLEAVQSKREDRDEEGGGRDVWAEERGQISHHVECGRRVRHTAGRMENISVLCLAASQLLLL